MQEVAISLGAVSLSAWFPDHPVAYTEESSCPLTLEINAHAETFWAWIKGVGDLQDFLDLHNVLSELERKVGYHADAEFRLSLDYGGAGWLHMKFSLAPHGSLTVDAAVGAGPASETRLWCSSELDQSWLRIWIGQIAGIIRQFVPAFTA